MKNESIPFCKTSYFSKLICDYLAQEKILEPFYDLHPSLDNLIKKASLKGKNYSKSQRELLVTTLKGQYENTSASELSLANIKALASPNTYTITTGHQLNLFTGPLYVFYKIFDVINLAARLNAEQEEYKFVPVFWMATEDHDFEEINHFYFKGEKFEWYSDQKGAVGRFNTKGLESVFSEFSGALGNGKKAVCLKELFRKAYLEHKTLTEATKYLINELFGDHGLVIIDGDSSTLKESFKPIVQAEVKSQLSNKQISKTTDKLLAAGYHKQVHPRDINLFYLDEAGRHRISQGGDDFVLVDTDKSFTKAEILAELDQNPLAFSPNALLRPVYQEVVLPNVTYIGGGGEMAYWFQLKDYFDALELEFPILLVRTSGLLVSEKQAEKTRKLDLSFEDLFLNELELDEKKVQILSEFPIDFTEQKQHLKDQFKSMYTLAEQTDKSFLGAVAAQEKKQLKGLKRLEKRLLQAQKRKYQNELDRVQVLKSELFPKQNLQERISNFSEFYLAYGDELYDEIASEMEVVDAAFKILVLK